MLFLLLFLPARMGGFIPVETPPERTSLAGERSRMDAANLRHRTSIVPARPREDE